jgi:subtilase family serine protease
MKPLIEAMCCARRLNTSPRRRAWTCLFGRFSRTGVRAAGWAEFHLEALEGRVLLSVVATTTSGIEGFTPSQIARAYEFDKISFADSTVPASGAGQTIAIVDAYNDPKITTDLGVFDSQFGLPAPPSFKVVNQTGGGVLPSSTGSDAASWASTISLDVEWAHALAPGANILLVEANSNNLDRKTSAPDDLLAAAKYAASAPGVSVVSMDWGNFEFSNQTTYDSIFTTPAGHQGVTFVTSAGDTGSDGDVNWPASSPNVLSVGSTTLTTSDASGTYSAEASLSGSSGGYSSIEPEPVYQNVVQSTGKRSSPDVAIDGDPATGIAVYDSLPATASQTSVGWEEFGTGGAPQWAALIAIADQGRALAGEATLDGATQTLPTLYGLYSAPGTSGYANYTSYFNDVIDSAPVPTHGFVVGGNQAAAGYDTATGLGTPHAAALVDALVMSSVTTPTPTPVTPGLTPEIVGTLPAALVAGQKSKATVTVDVTNEQVTPLNGPATIQLFASSGATMSSEDTLIGTLSKTLKLKPGKSQALKFSLAKIPATLPAGNYFMVAKATDSAGVTHTASSTTTVAIAQPFVDLVAAAASVLTKAMPGKKATASVLATNGGNVPGLGEIPVAVLARPVGTTGSQDIPLASVTAKINLKPARGKLLRLKFILPGSLPAGMYQLVVRLDPGGTFPESNTANDTAVSAGTFTIA